MPLVAIECDLTITITLKVTFSTSVEGCFHADHNGTINISFKCMDKIFRQYGVGIMPENDRDLFRVDQSN